jgi:hypothetical protein
MKKYQLKNSLNNRTHDNSNYHAIEEGVYTADNTDLKVIIHKIYYKNEEFFKARYSLVNKHNGIIYDSRKKTKFYKKNIGHWTALE